MSDPSIAPSPGTPDQDGPVVNPVSNHGINLIGGWSVLLTVLFFYLLITTWPVPDFAGTVFRPVNIFGWSFSWSPDRQMLVTVMMSGALGSLIHTMTSFGDYVGNRKLSSNWLWFLGLRIPIGIAIAVLFYLIIRGGILVPTIQGKPELSDWSTATLKINPYAIAGFSALAGMFSKQATDKLATVFDSLFSIRNPVVRQDPLGARKPAPAVSTTDPKQLTNKSTSLTIQGQGFHADCTVSINGKERKPASAESTKIVVPLDPSDVASPGELKVTIKNPDGGSVEAVIKVV